MISLVCGRLEQPAKLEALQMFDGKQDAKISLLTSALRCHGKYQANIYIYFKLGSLYLSLI